MSGRRGVRVLLTSVAITATVQIGGLQAAHADATDHTTQASCMGYEASSISPPGSSGEEPGGVPQFVAEVKELASGSGISPGALFSFIASLHEGSHEDCDEALGG
jgi:hypothetical protein